MISYKIKAKLAKNIGTDDFSLEEFEKTFINKTNPIKARKEAYHYYLSIIDIIGSGGNDFSTIEEHINSVPKQKIELDGDIIEHPKYYGLGVGIYLLIDENEKDFYDEKFYEWLIIGYSQSFDYLSVAVDLEQEIQIYKNNGWDTEDWTVDIKYWDYEATGEVGDEEVNELKVLYTPFDFWEYHNPSKAESREKVEEANQIPLFEYIIDKGENRKLEFKSTLRYCLNKKQPKDYIEHAILKTIVAFANTKGGLLFIGVSDEGEIIGIDNDLQTFKEYSKDKFLKHFDNLIKVNFTSPIDAILEYELMEIKSKLVFLIKVKKSEKPRFLNTKLKGKEFYIRRSASSNSLDIEETVQYIIDKWYA